MSASSAEKERAIVLEESIVSYLNGESGFQGRCAMAAGWRSEDKRTTGVGGHWASSPGRGTRL